MSETATEGPSAMQTLLAPDGYYSYLGLNAKDATKENWEDLVKKSYRKLSLKHHPDRPNGDAATFRILNRAQKVLSTASLRKQYDLVGLDLEDEDQNQDHHDDSNADDEGAHTPDSTMSALAANTLAGVLRVFVQTCLLALTVIVVSQYTITLILSFIFLAYLGLQFYSAAKQLGPQASPVQGITIVSLIGLGLYCMYCSGRTEESSYVFWLGESLVMGLFIYNSATPESTLSIMGICIVVPILTAFLKGRVWRYAMLLGAEAGLGLLAIIIFPIMEMILDELVNEKLRKVGEKVRAHAARSQRK